MQMSVSPDRREVVVKKIGVLSAAKMYGAIAAAFGILIGCMFAVAGMIGAGFAPEEGSALFGAMFGVGAIILLPLIYGVMGFVSGAIGAALYNLFAAMVGGVSLELECTRPRPRSRLDHQLAASDQHRLTTDTHLRDRTRHAGDRHVHAARASHRDPLQAHHAACLLGRDDPVFEQVRTQRAAGTPGCRVLDDAEARSEHAAIDRHVLALHREDEDREFFDAGLAAALGDGAAVRGDGVHR